METKKERMNRIVARGETSGHSHIITGDAELIRDKENVIVKIKGNCALKHLLETPFVKEGREEWTKEHFDASAIDELIKQAKDGEVFIRHGDVFVERIDDNTAKIIIQQEYNPYLKAIQKVQD
jgi:hypothetical protein